MFEYRSIICLVMMFLSKMLLLLLDRNLNDIEIPVQVFF